MTRRDVYLVCGGRWHDFDFARLELLKLLAEDDRVRVNVAADYLDLDAISRADALVTYTCDVRPTARAQTVLRDFVADGGRWLALHGTNAVLEQRSDGQFEAPRVLGPVATVLGSQFLSHPPITPYKVEVIAPDHPLVAGIEAFETDDELYLSKLHAPEEHTVLLATRWSGDTGYGFVDHEWPDDDLRPVLYVRPFGKGEVVYFTLGHCRGHYDMQPMLPYYPVVERGSWERPEFVEILRRAIRWAVDTDKEHTS